jgi:glycerol-3-phosphate acyltransferase PlsX
LAAGASRYNLTALLEGAAATLFVTTPIIISIDAMGGDHGPSVIVPGVARAAASLKSRGARVLLHGDAAKINAELARCPAAREISEVRHSDSVISMDEKPGQAMRRGKGSSMWNAVEAVKTSEAQACVSAGNTGALMAISKLLLRMVAPGLERPAIVAGWPGMNGHVTTVLDVGANIDCDAERLVDFAIMGEAFHRAIHGVARPTVALLNVGSEDVKGHDELRGAHAILKDGGLPLDYRGFAEGDDLSRGEVDVVVTDGFTGNIALKTAEGTARFVASEMRSAFTASLLTKIGAFIAQSALKRLKARLDPNSVNGGPLLGLKGVVIKSHGSADQFGFANAINVAADLAQSNFAAEIEANMQKLTAVLAHGSESAGAST